MLRGLHVNIKWMWLPHGAMTGSSQSLQRLGLCCSHLKWRFNETGIKSIKWFAYSWVSKVWNEDVSGEKKPLNQLGGVPLLRTGQGRRDLLFLEGGGSGNTTHINRFPWVPCLSLSLYLVLFLLSSFLVFPLLIFLSWLVSLLLFHAKNNIKTLLYRGCFHQSFLFFGLLFCFVFQIPFSYLYFSLSY